MDTNETTNQSENKNTDSPGSVVAPDVGVMSYVLANIKPIGVILLVVIILSRLFAPGNPPTIPVTKQATEKNAEDLIQKPDEMVKSEQLTKLPSIQDDYQFAVDYLRKYFAENGFETSTFRLTDVSEYYITPAQEANGLQQAKKLTFRFAMKVKGAQQWIDFAYLGSNNMTLDMAVWNGERQINFTNNFLNTNLSEALERLKNKDSK